MYNIMIESNMLSDRRQIPQRTDCDIPFIRSSKQVKVADGLGKHETVILGK